jgi:hypothetical protein
MRSCKISLYHTFEYTSEHAHTAHTCLKMFIHKGISTYFVKSFFENLKLTTQLINSIEGNLGISKGHKNLFDFYFHI